MQQDWKNPARLKDETQEQYKVRRSINKRDENALSKGTLFWDSAKYGTYTNPEKRQLQAERKARKAQRKKGLQ